jgi:hypothetical protein
MQIESLTRKVSAFERSKEKRLALSPMAEVFRMKHEEAANYYK